MSVASICTREVVTIQPDEDLVAAARLMREAHVGYLVVLDKEGTNKPVGVITDRDIIVAVVACEVDPRSLTVGDVMSRELRVVQMDSPVSDAVGAMCQAGVRRAPVVNADGTLAGVLSVADVLDEVAAQLVNVAGSIRNERRIERHTRP